MEEKPRSRTILNAMLSLDDDFFDKCLSKNSQRGDVLLAFRRYLEQRGHTVTKSL